MSPLPSLRMSHRTLSLILICITLVAVALAWTSPQQAASSITVNSLSDVANAGDGLCTLREAITAANTDTVSGAAAGECGAGSGSGSDAINFSVTGTINLTSALPDIASSMTIIGPGSSQLTVKRNTSDFYRIFNVASGVVSISGMTITNGNSSGSAKGGGIQNLSTLSLTDIAVNSNQSGTSDGFGGGGVFNQGTLTMTNCSVTGNSTPNTSAQMSGGGGIANAGTLTLINCAVNNNQTGNSSSNNGGFGGGIFNTGAMTLTATTISNNLTGTSGNNLGGLGGGIYNNSAGSVSLFNCTIADNNTGNGPGAKGYGGGIYTATAMSISGSTISGNTGNILGVPSAGISNDATMTLVNSTISGNHGNGITNSNLAAGSRLTNCTITLNEGSGVGGASNATARNSIIAGNTGDDVVGTNVSNGHNLIGNKGTSTGFVNGSNGDQVGTSGSPIEAHLGPLANNGGPTKTHALLSNSTALDAGDNCVTDVAHCGDSFISQLTTEQRGSGFSRQVDGPDGDSTATVDIGAYELQTPLANLPDTGTNEDTQKVVAFDPGDTSTITSVTATSSDSTLVPNDAAHLSVSVIGTTGVLTINPAANEHGSTNITITINRSVGGPDSRTFLLTVNAANDAPSFTKGADQTVNEDSGAQSVPAWATGISPGPADESSQLVTFTVTNGNNGLFASQPAVGSDGTLTYTPAADAAGSALVTVTAQDNGGTANGGVDTSSQTFTITLNGINDAPSFTKGADQTSNEDAGPQTVTNWATGLSRGPADESAQTLTFQITDNTNTALFSAGPAVSSTGTLTYTPAANAHSSATITLNLKDNGGTANGGVDTSASQTFVINVNAVNDAPSFVKGADQAVNEDGGAQTVVGWATSISPGPADEAGQTVSFNVTGNTNASLFSAGPAIAPNGTLTYTPAANSNGSATITLTLQDNGGVTNGGADTSASQSFTITVNAVNDAPSFTKGADQTVNEDAGAQAVTNWATNRSAGPPDESGQTLSFQITNNTNTALFSAAPAVSSTGMLTYTPAANANGLATISVVIKDNGGTANGGVDTSAAQTFTITVNAVNDVPLFTKGANQTVTEDAGAQTVNSWATSLSVGPADESGQALSFQITNNTNTALFSAGPAVSSTGTLTYTPAANANGLATITLVIKDDGGTANGGVDTSASQSFTVSVTAVNDAPSFTKGADQTVNNNAGAQTVANWATNISRGPNDEAGQTLTFQITNNTNSSLFSAGPAVSSSGTLTYTPSTSSGGAATITINLRDSGGTLNGGVDTSAAQTFTITVTPVGGFVNFTSATGNTTENSGSTTVNVTRSGDTSKAVTVNYATNAYTGVPCSTANGVASPKCDFTTALGTLSFAAGETNKSITILISQDSFVEGPEAITLTLSSPTGGTALGTQSSMSVTILDDVTEPPGNIIDDANMFVRMHYHDFLNREADQSGLDFWTVQMTNCGSADLLVCRVNVSGAFFLSIEFQQTGYLVERMYKTAYGDATSTSTLGGAHAVLVPTVRANEFLAGTQRIDRGVVVLQPGWEQVLENNKQAYALEFVQTSRFITALPTSMTPPQFVDKLNQNAGLVLSPGERTTAINLFGIAADTTNVNARAQALRQIAEDQDLFQNELNRAFVLAQYIGYLRRNPNDAPEPTLDYTGYDFWLTKLSQSNGDYVAAEMVKAFIASSEYRQRFGQ